MRSISRYAAPLVHCRLPTHTKKLEHTLEDSIEQKQGRIHGYPSHMRVGRGNILGHLITWAGAVKPKTAKKTKQNKKVKCDGPTDGPTKRGVESRPITFSSRVVPK